MAAADEVIFSKDGVFIHTTVVPADEDALVAGSIFLTRKDEGMFVEWKPTEVNTTQGSDEWAMIDAVSYNRSSSQSGSIQMNRKKEDSTHHRYKINFDINDLKSFKRSKPNLGWSYLIFILKCGTTCPALHFHHGGTTSFIRKLDEFLSIKKAPTDGSLYLVREHDPEALSKSFDHLKLFEEQKPDIFTNIINDPYTATLGGFSKVTKMLRAGLQLGGLTDDRPASEMAEVSTDDLISSQLDDIALDNQQESGFAVITKRFRVELPERKHVTRSMPVTMAIWREHMNPEINDGQVINLDLLKDRIFRGGIESTVRSELWKFLLGYYGWDSTTKSREEHRQKRVDDYFRMKLQWKSVTDDQESRFFTLRDRKNLIDKDVMRTDRTHPFFCGEENPNLQLLNDILMTYCQYNFDLGYVQGMSDLLAPILVIMENEVDAFWCFAGFMEQVWRNFELNQEGMKQQLHNLFLLVNFTDQELCNYLESHESSNMYFCFRWLLIMFKREFSFPDIMRLWEVLWTGLPCKNFHLLLCLAILDSAKSVLIENNFGFTEILKHINDMSNGIDLEDILRVAEGIYLQVTEYDATPPTVYEMLGIQTDNVPEDDEVQSVSSDVEVSSSTPVLGTTPSHAVTEGEGEGSNEKAWQIDISTSSEEIISSTNHLSAALMEMNDVLTDIN